MLCKPRCVFIRQFLWLRRFLSMWSCFPSSQAYSSGWSARQIVTGVSERGSEPVIRYWIQERALKKPAETGPHAAKKQVRRLASDVIHIHSRRILTTDPGFAETGIINGHHRPLSSHRCSSKFLEPKCMGHFFSWRQPSDVWEHEVWTF